MAAGVLAGRPAARLLADIGPARRGQGTGSTRRCGCFPGGRTNGPGRSAVRGRLATFQGDPDNAIADISESIRLAGELGDELAAARGYLYLNLALTFAGQYEQALAAGQIAAERLAACDHRLGLVFLQPQTRAPAPAGRGRRRGPGVLRARPGDAGGLRPTGRGAVDHRLAQPDLRVRAVPAPGSRRRLRRRDPAGRCRRCAISAIEAGIAYCLEVLGWLAARGARSERAAWLLGAADALWRRTSGRLSNVAVMEQRHQRAAKQAREALGGLHYENAHDRGGALDLATVVAWAVGRKRRGAMAGPRRLRRAMALTPRGAIAGGRGRERGRPRRRRRRERARGGRPVTASPDQARAGDRAAGGERAV